tara:strand:- start:20 stop:169 length:150 start_codon:yes stop_codon:yes gene_type:complete
MSIFLKISIEPLLIWRGENPQWALAKRINSINISLKIMPPFKLQDLLFV